MPSLTSVENRSITSASPEHSFLEAKVWGQAVDTVKDTIGLVGEQLGAEALDARTLLRAAQIEQAEALASANTDRWSTSQLAAENLALVLLSAPFAAESQHLLNGGTAVPRHIGQEHKVRLSQFNHHLAQTAAYATPDMLRALPANLAETTAKLYGNQAGLDRFDTTEYRQLLAGASRETATLAALTAELDESYSVRSGSTAEDLRGIDLVVGRGEVEKCFDLKTHNAFSRRLQELQAKGRISAEAADAARTQGYLEVTYAAGQAEPIPVTIVNTDSIARLRDFRYQQPERVAAFYAGQLAA